MPPETKQRTQIEYSNELPKTLGIIYSHVEREFFPTEAQYITEKDARDDAEKIAKYTEKLGIEPLLYPADTYLSERLKKEQPDIVLNLVDSIKGQEYLSSFVPGLLESLNIPYTGAGLLGCALCYNKFLVKKLLEQSGVPVPNCQLFVTPDDQLNSDLRFPVISKLNEIHGGVEITHDCVSENEEHLRQRLEFLISHYDQPVLVEEFISGKEVSAYIFEGLSEEVFLAETIFTKPERKYNFTNFEAQWLENEKSYYYKKYVDPILSKLAKKAFAASRMAGYGKFDIRIDADNNYYFIDSNPNQAFGPKESNFPMSEVLEDFYDIKFLEILQHLIIHTLYGFRNGKQK